MTQQHPKPLDLLIVLSEENQLGRIAVDLQAFVEFSGQLSSHLAELEQRFERFATPVRAFRADRARFV